MSIQLIFSTGIGAFNNPEILEECKKTFDENSDLFLLVGEQNNFKTTLKKYNSSKAIIQNYKNSSDIEKIKSVIKKNVIIYLDGCGYRTDNIFVEIPNIWLNEMQSNSESPKHTHYGASISGCYYVTVPKNSGNITFYNSKSANETCPILEIKEYNLLNSDNWSLEPKEGDMFLWKSDLAHAVLPMQFDGVRKSIAFDAYVNVFAEGKY